MYWMNFFMAIPMLLLPCISVAGKKFHFTIPDIIELPLCLLIIVPPMIAVFVLYGRWFDLSNFVIVEEKTTD